MLGQVFLAHFEPVVTCFGPWKIPKCLENGPFWDQKWVKNGSKARFSKSDPGPFGMLKQVFLAHFEPVVTCFGPWKISKRLEKWVVLGPKVGQKWVKNAFFQKRSWTIWDARTSVFSPFGAHLDGFWPMEIPKCLERGLFWEQKWVKKGSKIHFFKSDLGPLGVHKKMF